MAKTPKLPLERYKRVAKDLAPVSPKIAAIAKKKTLTANDKRAITRAEDKAHEWSAGSQRIIPLTPKQVKQLKDKSLLIPGFNAVVDRNLGRSPSADIKDGDLYINDNGRPIHIISASSKDHEKFAEIGCSLFKGRKRRNVWVRFANGRSDTAFTDCKALLNFLVRVWEQYQPEWEKQGLNIDQMMIGFEVYTQGGKITPPTKPTLPYVRPKKRRKPVKKTTRKPVKKTTRKISIPKRAKANKPIKKFVPKKQTRLKKLVKFKPKKQTKLKPVKKSSRLPIKKRKPTGRGTKKVVSRKQKNRRH